MEDADIMFYGRFESAEPVEKERFFGKAEIAEFTVVKSYKGSPSSSVFVINYLLTSCDRSFRVSNRHYYYIFAKSTDVAGTYRASGFTSFFSFEKDAELEFLKDAGLNEYEVPPELLQHKKTKLD